MQNVEEKCSDNLTLCPKFEKVFEILGKKWNGLILETLLTGGALRFKDIVKCIDKCSDRVLVERLKSLENEGLIERRTYEDSSLIEYRLTKVGKEMRPVLESIHKFADCWY